MTQQKIVDAFNTEYNKQKGKVAQYIGASDTSNIVDVTWRTDQVTQQFILGLNEILKPLEKKGDIEPGFIKNEVTERSIKRAITKVIANIKRGGGGYSKHLQLEAWEPTNIKPGSFYLRRAKGGVGLTFRFISTGRDKGTGANDTKLTNVAFQMREEIYFEWLNRAEDFFNKLPKAGRYTGRRQDKGRRTKTQGVITSHTQQAHEKQTTKGAIMLGLLKQINPKIDIEFNIEAIDVIEQIESNILLDYGRNFKKGKVGKFSFRYWIETSIRANKAGSEESDISSIKEKETKKAVNDIFKERHGPITAWLRKIDGSVPIDTQIIEDSIQDIVVPLTKSGKPDKRYKVTKKLSARKFKPVNQKIPNTKKPRAKTGIKRSKAKVSLAASVARPSQQKREKVDDLLKIETLINKRLPAEVRRQMGRPALINRTSRFSNSTELRNLRQTKAGLSGEYTYQLSPYETFENTGGIRWPEGYNPKPLIAKSIRELAMQYTGQKLVSLRRR